MEDERFQGSKWWHSTLGIELLARESKWEGAKRWRRLDMQRTEFPCTSIKETKHSRWNAMERLSW